jgi:two-component system, chemotaxis family, sensor kinase CheA
VSGEEDAGLEDLFRPEEVEEIRRTFFDQAEAALDALTQGVLDLEGELPSEERLTVLRRAAHTLKGDCASVGFPALSGLSHALEDAFVGLARHRVPVGAAQSDLFLRAVDAFREALAAGPETAGTRDTVAALAEALRASSASERDVPSWMTVLDDAQRERVAGARERGSLPLHLVLEFSEECRNPARTAQDVLEASRLEVVAQVPSRRTGAGRKRRWARLDVLALGTAPAEETQRGLPVRPGLSIRVEDGSDRLSWSPGRPSLGVDPAREGDSVRVEARRVDEVLNLVGEMVMARATLAGLFSEIDPYLPGELMGRLGDAQSVLGRVLQDLQRSAMRMRMVPADRVFRRFSRVSRDLARSMGKRVTLQVEGRSTELDRGILDALEEPLLHIVRNAIYHGLETSEERRAAGKDPTGRVTLRAGREGNQVLVEVIDDGRGARAEVVRARAVEKGLIEPAEAAALTDAEALQLIFRHGLSTSPDVNEISGRGVGLDVVRQRVEALKGSVGVESTPGVGTTFRIRVPLTVAIIQALLFRVGTRDYAVPLTSVVEIARSGDLTVQSLGAREVFRLREEVLGLARIRRLLGQEGAGPASSFVIVLQREEGRFGIVVDELLGEQELVIKAVHDSWIRTPLVAGASVVGGALVLILDVLAVYRAALAVEDRVV